MGAPVQAETKFGEWFSKKKKKNRWGGFPREGECKPWTGERNRKGGKKEKKGDWRNWGSRAWASLLKAYQPEKEQFGVSFRGRGQPNQFRGQTYQQEEGTRREI